MANGNGLRVSPTPERGKIRSRVSSRQNPKHTRKALPFAQSLSSLRKVLGKRLVDWFNWRKVSTFQCRRRTWLSLSSVSMTDRILVRSATHPHPQWQCSRRES
ncbi:hypothetical protein GBA52_029038 [Prunus armeniaca]|nr:hypothetical protein GBA52_029038 [Prunus armeniaca]